MTQLVRTALRKVPEIGKFTLIILTILFIAFLFPHGVRFGYQYEVGAVWGYKDLYAPFDFPVLKSEAEIRTETAQAQREIAPCYVLDPQVVRDQKMVFEEAFQQQLSAYKGDPQFGDVVRNARKYLDYGTGLLDRLYAQGIIELTPEHRSSEPNMVINVIKGNTTQRQTLQSLLTPEKAQSVITDSLPYSRLSIAEFLLPILPDAIIPNLFFDDTLTQRFRIDQMSGFVAYRGIVQKNELIVGEGQIITEETYQKLRSYEEAYQEETVGDRSVWTVLAGYLLLTSLIIGIFVVYLRVYAKPIFKNFRWLVFILMWLLGYSYLVYAVEQTDVISLYLIPFCIAPIVTKILYTDRLAIFTHLVVVLLSSFLSSMGFEFALLQIMVGIVAVMTNPDGRDWSKLFRSLIFVYVTYSVGFVGLSLVERGTLIAEDRFFFGWIFLNVFLTMLAYPMVPLLERIFGFTSSVSLSELSDLNRPLLRELAIKAPGTLQHSLQVGHLGEAAATAVGADALLVKVGALYHDIGKTANPAYFIENQTHSNPHEKEDLLESAQIIIRHVTEGLQMAKKARLPEVVAEFIATHHGTTRVEYFYRLFLQDNPDGAEMEAKFQYPGPRPKTREQTILMLADSLEASSKSLKNPTGKDIDELVEKIISGKIAKGQLEESQLSFEELKVCKAVFQSRLRSMYHVRIEYPKEQETD
ncbi:MAG: HDIG domain-containing protein [Saprospirales bacterium]|nr:HDIG domain-containing protein [Saprospirales bacterium]